MIKSELPKLIRFSDVKGWGRGHGARLPGLYAARYVSGELWLKL